ncbi:hypothetical protein [Allomuricauda sp. SCSIO 65647]|uniref:hypothetical protein n=1 Tax=Allomuricauda sp. SCSIO 65647 TaxID=2908843 RepID=UPI001F42A219|nr:hypothetical protein [Muricauda sp. SCSIO 65647]UJH66628.1 hypothetical protein L0P89_11715 [Muricauda sp. SCSIO 65647]
MKKCFLAVVVLNLMFLSACIEKDTTFLITETSIGPLQKTTIFDDVENIFAQDSIVKDTFRLKSDGIPKKIKVFEKGGKHLLTLKPSQDSVPKVENIQVFDSRYLTESGIGLRSTFKDIQTRYKIRKIVTTLKSVVIFPKESDLYFTIDKEELPSALRYSTSNIEAVQIPDEAKIKYLMMGWE